MTSSELLLDVFRFVPDESGVEKNLVNVPGLDIGAQTQLMIRWRADRRTSGES